MPTVVYGEFEWDEEKNLFNQQKHGIAFEESVVVFQADFLKKDVYHALSGELRHVALGVLQGKPVAVIYTIRGKRRRIISARRMHHEERQAFQNQE